MKKNILVDEAIISTFAYTYETCTMNRRRELCDKYNLMGIVILYLIDYKCHFKKYNVWCLVPII